MTQEDLSVKKERPTARAGRLPVGVARRTLFATSELFRSLSLASADGFRAFSNAVDPEIGNEDRDLVRDVTDAMFDANRRYVNDLGSASRQFVDVMLQERDAMAESVPDIDYERLAKLVAAEMQKSSAAASQGPKPTAKA